MVALRRAIRAEDCAKRSRWRAIESRDRDKGVGGSCNRSGRSRNRGSRPLQRERSVAQSHRTATQSYRTFTQSGRTGVTKRPPVRANRSEQGVIGSSGHAIKRAPGAIGRDFGAIEWEMGVIRSGPGGTNAPTSAWKTQFPAGSALRGPEKRSHAAQAANGAEIRSKFSSNLPNETRR
jgi:hypothetical protein